MAKRKETEKERYISAALAKLNPLERQLFDALTDASSHLEYCGYGDKWERECAREQKLEEKIIAALVAAMEKP